MKKIFLLTAVLLFSMTISWGLDIENCKMKDCSCNVIQNLPRADKDAMESFKPYGDRVFSDVWGRACNELHSLMVVKDGKVLYERWSTGHEADELHIMWSASKTFTATAAGFAVQEGLLRLDDRVVSFFTEEELPAMPSGRLESMTVRNLLTMSSGFDTDFIGRANSGEDFDWAKETLALNSKFEPGAEFSYNSMDTYLLSVIVSRVTGMKVADYLDDRLFRHIGITEYEWEESPQGYTAGGWGLFLSTESFAKMCLFFLQKGVWNGKRLLNEAWFDQAGTNQIVKDVPADRDDFNSGYGFQMWVCHNDAPRFDGAWSQFGIILYDKNAVVVTTAHCSDGKLLLDSVWDNIDTNL